jgi:hypothetical protein
LGSADNFGTAVRCLESYGWDYLVKVKLKNLENILESQVWIELPGNKGIAICLFSYKANGWGKPRVLKAMQTVKEFVRVTYLGREEMKSTKD